MKDTQILPAGASDGTGLQSQAKPTRRILVVEDDTAIRQLNAQVLTHSGYAVDVAEDGEAAWEALRTDSYDLIITDHNMPKVTGVELLQKLRAVRMDLPVILATGTLPTEDFSRYPWIMSAAILLKPYTVAQLLGTVEEALRAPVGDPGQIAPPPNSESRVSADELQA